MPDNKALTDRLYAYMKANPPKPGDQYPTLDQLEAWEQRLQPAPKRERFVVEMATSNPDVDAYCITDTDSESYHMPTSAVTLRLRRLAAIKVCVLLNMEWEYFLSNPT